MSNTYVHDEEKGSNEFSSGPVTHTVTDELQHELVGHHAHKKHDIAEAFFAEHHGEAPITEEEIRAVRRKIDKRFIPLTMFAFMLAYIDKQCLGNSSLFGILETYDLSVGNRYSLANAIFYVGYIPGAFILPAIAQRLPLGKCSGFFVGAWGLVCLLTVVVQNWQGLYAQRFFLGFMEGGISPCFLLATGMWYRKAEQPLRTGLWYGASGIAIIISQPICVGLVKQGLRNGMGTDVWKTQYYLWGSVTFLYGFVVAYVMPDSPVTAKFLNERERYVAIERLRVDQSGVKATFQAYQLLEAALDHRLWLLVLISFGMLTVNGSISAFQPIIVRSFGFDVYQTTYLGIVTGAITILAIWPTSYIATRYRNMRTACQMFASICALIAFALLYTLNTSNVPGRLASVYLLAFYSPAFTQCMAFAASNFAGYTKKTVAGSVVFIGYCLGNIAGPLFFVKTESPTYPTGFKAVMICVAGALACEIAHGFSCWFTNRRRERLGRVAEVDRAFHDYTDKENLTFRYNW